ncbi:DUF6168 family protein [Tamlana crocina]
MIKRILVFALCAVLLFAVAFSVHNYFVAIQSFSLLQVYLFHAVASLVIYVSVELISDVRPNQAGYVYLTFTLVKLGLFVLIFKNEVFENEVLTKSERIALVVPLFLFLTAEAVGVSKLLNNK